MMKSGGLGCVSEDRKGCQNDGYNAPHKSSLSSPSNGLVLGHKRKHSAIGTLFKAPKFIVVTDSMRAIDMAWESGGADFQSRFDKATAQAEEMKKGVLRVL